MPPVRLEDLYAVLEVPHNADITAIKKSYRKLVLKYHPDKNPDDRTTSQKKIRDINDAYAILGNPQKRADHERHAQFSVVLTQASATTRSLLGVNWSGNNVNLPSQFLVIPVGNADKFLRDMDRSFVFHSREEAKNTEFIEFFAFSTFGLHWLPDASSAFSGHRARFGAPCRLQRCSPVLAALGVTEHLRTASNSQIEMWKPPSDKVDVGCVSFGLMAGCMSASSVKLCSSTKVSGDVSDIRILPSPVYPNAYRFESAFYPGHFLAFDPPAGCLMTGTLDQFSVVDFVVEDVRSCMRFQTLDEVLLPVVQRLGGQTKSVPLTEICQDVSVRTFFQMGMQCEWDFDDFAIYFHAHSENWEYDEQSRSLRIRQHQATATSKQNALENQPLKRQKLEPNRNPTKVLVLANLVGAGEVDEDLQEETAEEARKYGKLNKCIIEELKGVPDADAVRIFLEFDAVESAAKAFDVFSGRIFDGRAVKAWFYDETVYKEGNLKKFE